MYFHFVNDMVARTVIDVELMSIKDQLADIYINPLSLAHFTSIRFKFNVVSLARRVKESITDQKFSQDKVQTVS